MDYLIGYGLIGATALVLVLFFLFYERIWKSITDEPFTNLLRRNKLRSFVLILAGTAAGGGLAYLSLPRAWPWYTWVVVAMGFVWILTGHIFWAGMRWGAIHKPTAWRCVEELRLMAVALEEGPERASLADASEKLGARLEEEGYEFRSPTRHGDRRGLADL